MISDERTIELALISEIEHLYVEVRAHRAITSYTETCLQDINELYIKLDKIKQDRING